MAAYHQVYDSRHLQADCQEPGSAPEHYARQSSMGYLYLFLCAGRLGLSNEDTYFSPQRVDVTTFDHCRPVDVVCGIDCTMILCHDGSLLCCGSNRSAAISCVQSQLLYCRPSLPSVFLPSVLWRRWLDVRKSIWPRKFNNLSDELLEIRCRLFACCPADVTVIPKPHHLLPHLNPDWFCLSGTGLPSLSRKRSH